MNGRDMTKSIEISYTNLKMIEKQCAKCKVVEFFSELHSNLRHNDGKQSHCRDCQKEIKLQWNQNNSEHVKKYNLEWKRNIPEYMTEYQNNRYATDIKYKLSKNLRNRLRKAF